MNLKTAIKILNKDYECRTTDNDYCYFNNCSECPYDQDENCIKDAEEVILRLHKSICELNQIIGKEEADET